MMDLSELWILIPGMVFFFILYVKGKSPSEPSGDMYVEHFTEEQLEELRTINKTK